jgi:Flp pilus assembly protein TadG
MTRAVLARLGRDRRGIVAVEFALIAPFLLALLFGLFEVSSLVRVSLKLSHAANNLAKIIAQQQPPDQQDPAQVSQSQLADFCTGAGYALSPYSTGSLSAAVVSLTSSKGGTPTADWEYDAACAQKAGAYGATAASMAGSGGYALTPSAGDSVIVVRASYTYTPILHYVLGSSWTLTQTAFSRPRSGATIACSDCS